MELGQIDQKAFVIGGYVRDQILNRTTKDIDIVTVGSGIELAKKTAEVLNSSTVKVFKNFGTAMILSLIHISEPTRPY